MTADPSVTDVGERNVIELVAFIIVLMVAVSIGLMLVGLVVDPAWIAGKVPVTSGLLVLYVPLFVLNHTRHHRIAAIVLSLAPLGANVAVGLSDPAEVGWYALVPVSTIIAGHVLSLRHAIAVGIVSVAATSAVVFARRDYYGVDGTAIVIVVTLLVVIILGLARFRARVQRERLAEVERLGAQLAATERLESVGRFAAGVAHDFNNLLTVILANVDLSRRRAHDAELLDGIEDAATRAATLTRQILMFTRNRARATTAVLVDDVLREMAPLLRRLLPEHVRVELALGAGAAIDVDEAQLQQVVLNLAANARDAMHSGGELRVVTSATDREVMIAVIDTGAGMDEPTRARAFEPFFSTKPLGAGTGIGLSTVRAVIAQSGGDVALDSAPGAGASITITLPRSERTPATSSTAVECRDRPRKGVALLVEDDAQVRAAAERVLRELGMTVVVAASAAEVPRALADAARPIDLVVSDVVLPGQGGLALVDELRAKHPGIAVVLISGYAEEDVVAAARRPDTRFVPKPFTASALIAAIDDLAEELDHRLAASTR